MCRATVAFWVSPVLVPSHCGVLGVHNCLGEDPAQYWISSGKIDGCLAFEIDQEETTDLGFLQGCHAAAEHGTAVPADVQEDLLVAPGAAVLGWLQHC